MSNQTTSSQTLPIVIVGHVDHGKSTLIGRLLYETDALPEAKVEEIRAVCKARGVGMEWAFLLDALQAERDQGITIDTTQIRFATEKRGYLIIDAPGHKEFLKNMVTGAASADAALLVIDAAEGVREQSRRHAYLLKLLGIEQVAVAVNKIDLIGRSEETFRRVEAEIRGYLKGLDIDAKAVIPVSARDGDNIAARPEVADWYEGPTVLEMLDTFEVGAPPREQALRLPVQAVYKFDDRRIIAGRIESGVLKVGDRLSFAPSGETSRVATIETWNTPSPVSAGAGRSVAFTLDDQIFVERGDVAVSADYPVAGSQELRVRLFWLGREPLVAGKRLKLKIGTAVHRVEVTAIERVIDVEDLSSTGGTAAEVQRNGVAEVMLRSRAPIVADEFTDFQRTGRGVLVDGYENVGGCIVAETFAAAQPVSQNIFDVDHAVPVDARIAANGHQGGVLWFTGLSGAGKSTLAMGLEKALFKRGRQVYVLDGDNLRKRLSSDLGFAPEDRTEHIRRVGEVAALFAEAGVIVIAALISPMRADRARARQAAPELFHEVFVKADVETCASRDPKGLYKKALAGEIENFTGVSAPYEAPEEAEVVVDTAVLSVEDAIVELVDYTENAFRPGVPKKTAVA